MKWTSNPIPGMMLSSQKIFSLTSQTLSSGVYDLPPLLKWVRTLQKGNYKNCTRKNLFFSSSKSQTTISLHIFCQADILFYYTQ